jgi:hypothetical protein
MSAGSWNGGDLTPSDLSSNVADVHLSDEAADAELERKRRRRPAGFAPWPTDPTEPDAWPQGWGTPSVL